MDCPNCSTTHAEAARFCQRCGTPLHGGIDRADYFAAMPDEPVRATVLISTLMPHLSGARMYVYRDMIGVVLLASLVASAFGALAIALVLAAIALPAAVLTYIYDHGVWRGDPVTTIGLGVVLSLVLGGCVGEVQNYFYSLSSASPVGRRFPSVTTILDLGIIVPVLIYIAVMVAPVIVTARPRLRNAVDTVVICTLSAAALSLGFTVLGQWGAFTQVTSGDPGAVAFIAVNWGFLQPIIYGTAAAVSVMALRRKGSNTLVGVIEGLALIVVYKLGATLLAPYGGRGIVLTVVLGIVVAAAGLVLTRVELHTALMSEAQEAVSGGALLRAPEADRVCGHCSGSVAAGAAFCQSCGTATAALGLPAAGKTVSHE
ncbi:MAG: hypothetical protein QOH57_4833 [Mycobacterium sp.]|nr:hypothetical protein [Mycobacterium sp.]